MMRNVNSRNLKVTYGQLASALSALGFSESRGKTDLNIPYRAFENHEHGTWTLLPDLADDDLVEPVYLRRAERTVTEWGVADSETFFNLLRGESRKEPLVA